MNAPRDLATLMDQGATAFKESRFADAATIYTEVIGLLPSSLSSPVNDEINLRAHNNRSGAFAALGHYEAALADARRCIALAPQMAKAHARAAAALHGLKRYAEAAQAYVAAAQQPDRKGASDPSVYRASADEMMMMMQMLQSGGAATVNPPPPLNGSQQRPAAAASSAAASAAASHKEFEEQQKRDQYYVDKHAAEAESASRAGQHRAAVDALTKAIKHERQRQAAANAHQQQQQLQSSSASSSQQQQQQQTFIGRDNKDNFLFASLLQRRSTALSHLPGKDAEALEDAEEANTICPHTPDTVACLVNCYVSLGRIRSARTVLDAAAAHGVAARCSSRNNNNNGGGGALAANSSGTSTTVTTPNLERATASLEAAEHAAQAKVAAALQEEQDAKRELQEAMAQRYQTGDAVGVDRLKRRNVEPILTVTAAAATSSLPAAATLGGMSLGKTTSVERCRFCSQMGHTSYFCPLKRK